MFKKKKKKKKKKKTGKEGRGEKRGLRELMLEVIVWKISNILSGGKEKGLRIGQGEGEKPGKKEHDIIVSIAGREPKVGCGGGGQRTNG